MAKLSLRVHHTSTKRDRITPTPVKPKVATAPPKKPKKAQRAGRR